MFLNDHQEEGCSVVPIRQVLKEKEVLMMWGVVVSVRELECLLGSVDGRGGHVIREGDNAVLVRALSPVEKDSEVRVFTLGEGHVDGVTGPLGAVFRISRDLELWAFSLVQNQLLFIHNGV